MGLIRTLIILGFFYYLFKFLIRLFAPFLIKYTADKMQDKFNQQYQAEEYKKETIGKTSVIKKPRSKKEINTNDTGEYIDYEEVK